MLFNIYIYMDPLGEVIMGFGLHYHLYVGDMQLYFSIPSDPKCGGRGWNSWFGAWSWVIDNGMDGGEQVEAEFWQDGGTAGWI